MNGFIPKTAMALFLAGGLSAAGGCTHFYDPCWPERYDYAARKEVCESFGPQVTNGRVLSQTVWNWHFEQSKDELTPGGRDFLTSLIHRRPQPDCTVYLATAQDLGDLKYDPKKPEEFVEKRTELDARRVEAIQKYLTAQTAGRNLHFQVVVHDPAVVDLSAIPVSNAVNGWYNSFIGFLPGGGGGGGQGQSQTQSVIIGGGGAPGGLR